MVDSIRDVDWLISSDLQQIGWYVKYAPTYAIMPIAPAVRSKSVSSTYHFLKLQKYFTDLPIISAKSILALDKFHKAFLTKRKGSSIAAGIQSNAYQPSSSLCLLFTFIVAARQRKFLMIIFSHVYKGQSVQFVYVCTRMLLLSWMYLSNAFSVLFSTQLLGKSSIKKGPYIKTAFCGRFWNNSFNIFGLSNVLFVTGNFKKTKKK